MFTINRLTEQLNEYMKKHVETQQLIHQITGAIHIIQQQIAMLQKEETEAKLLEDKEILNGKTNNQAEEQYSSEGLCNAEGEEIPCGEQEPRPECESESTATI
jgi:hypothetical protein